MHQKLILWKVIGINLQGLPGPDPGVGKRGTCPPEATASHTLPPVFFDITLLCISDPDTCDLQKTEFINDNERAISKWHAVICQ